MSGQQDHQGDQDGAAKDGSILARLCAAGIGEDRARSWIVSGGSASTAQPSATRRGPWPPPWTLTNL